MNTKYDVVVVGGGHNGLVAATRLARKKLRVLLLEAKSVFGGACRTEYPFRCAPQLGASTGAYLLGPMPPELISELGISLKFIPRDPYYFLPTRGGRSLLLGTDAAENHRQFLSCFSQADWDANQSMQADLERIRNAIAETWLKEPMSLIETAERCFADRKDRELFSNLCRTSVMGFLNKYPFRSKLLKAMYAVTDGLIGAYGSYRISMSRL